MREGKVPLRTVLQNFINHVDTIEAQRADHGEDVYEKEFQELKDITESLKSKQGFECSEGEKEINRRKNRYKDILPYDYTRVVLKSNGQEGDDYVNANFIQGAGGARAYIASQGPLAHTLVDFWRMVVQCEVQVIVMASNETEGGKHKCECYWVCSGEDDKQFGDVLVSFVKMREMCPDFLVRTLKITYTGESGERESRLVCQFHYSMWPDHGVPDTVRPLLSMVQLVRECQASDSLPLLVHCSAGCGRTGTICAIDHVWTLLRTGRLPDHVDLLVIVKEMRRQRVAMVQTRDQYILLHRAIRRLFHDRLALIDDHPYANVGHDGTPLAEMDSQNYMNSSALLPPPAVLRPPSPFHPQSPYSTPPHQFPRLPAPAPFSHTPTSPFQSPMTSTSPAVTPLTPSYPSLHNTNSSKSEPTILIDEVDSSSRSSSQILLTAKYSSPVGSTYSTPLGTPGSTPAVTPNTTPNPLQGIGLHLTPHQQQPPVPPTRSQTPSPVIALNKKAMDTSQQQHRKTTDQQNNSQHKYASNSFPCDNKPRKSSELTRRPSIQKLRELFETSGGSKSSSCNSSSSGGISETSDMNAPVVRLSRSASSVTLRNNTQLSLQSSNDKEKMRLRRKACLGSEESIHMLHVGNNGINNTPSNDMRTSHRLQQLSICPPPPVFDAQLSDSYPSRDQHGPLTNSHRWDGVNSVSSSPSTGNSKPSPSVNISPSSMRRRTQESMKAIPQKLNVGLKGSPVEERPALPIKIKKKSKSFRYNREQQMPINGVFAPTSDVATSKSLHCDNNNYFSLDRSRTEVSPSSMSGHIVHYRNNSSNSGKQESYNSFDQLSGGDGPKLSVFHSNESGVAAKNNSQTCEAQDLRPQIPPKKSQERLKHVAAMSSSLETVNCQQIQSSNEISLSQKFNENLLGSRHQLMSTYENSGLTQGSSSSSWKSPPSSDSEQSLYDQLPCGHKGQQISVESKASKDYVNARLVSNNSSSSQENRNTYVPLPSKRTTISSNHTQMGKLYHDYANFDLGSNNELSLNSEFVSSPRTPVPDKSHSSDYNSSDSQNRQSFTQQEYVNRNFTLDRVQPGASSSSFKADYEHIDFGENSEDASESEMVEVVNRTIVGDNFNRSSDVEHLKDCIDEQLHNSLDPIARQVYQDCEEYLLHGNNKSPVPSLLPPKNDTNSLRSNKSTSSRGSDFSSSPLRHHQSGENLENNSPHHNREHSSSNNSSCASMDVTDVASKVNIAPQGLRTRERRNSYRQAVNPLVNNWRSDKAHGLTNVSKKIEPNILESTEEIGAISTNSLSGFGSRGDSSIFGHKGMHNKYETIWFEKTRETSRSDENLRLTRSVVEDVLLHGGPATSHPKIPSFEEDSPVWVKRESNTKERQLIKNECDDLQGFVNSLERNKSSIKDSSCTNHNSDTYVNSNNKKTSSSSQEASNSKVSYSSHNVGEMQQSSSKSNEPIYVNTFGLRGVAHPPIHSQYQQQPHSLPVRPVNSTPPELNRQQTQSMSASNNRKAAPPLNSTNDSQHSKRATDTFPFISRPSDPPTPTKYSTRTFAPPSNSVTAHIKAPPQFKGFNNSNPSSPADGGGAPPKSDDSPYSLPPAASDTYGRRTYAKPSGPSMYGSVTKGGHVSRAPMKAHIVGDVAIVGDSAVRLRRARDRSVGSELLGTTIGTKDSPGGGVSPSTPVAPPRIKRHSSMSGRDSNSSSDLLFQHPTMNHYHQRSRTSGGGAEGSPHHSLVSPSHLRKSTDDDHSPPALPAKTLLHLPPPAPPASLTPPPPPPIHSSCSDYLLKRFSYHSNSTSSPSSTLSSSRPPPPSSLSSPYLHPPPPKPYLPPASQRMSTEISSPPLPPPPTTSFNTPPRPPPPSTPPSSPPLPPHLLLQRSLTSSAILVSSSKDRHERLDGSNERTGGGGPEQHYQTLLNNTPSNGANKAPSTNGLHSNGPATPNTTPPSASTPTSSSSKFFVPGLFRKLKSGVTPAKVNLMQSRQTYVNPHRFGEQQNGRQQTGVNGQLSNAGLAKAGDSNGVNEKNRSPSAMQKKTSSSGKKTSTTAATHKSNGVNSYRRPTGSNTQRNSNVNGRENQYTTNDCQTSVRSSKDDSSRFQQQNNPNQKSLYSSGNNVPQQQPMQANGSATTVTSEEKGKSKKGASAKTRKAVGEKTFPSPTSPKPLARALGRLKFLRSGGGSSSSNGSSSSSASCDEDGKARTAGGFNPLQKSASMGHNVFSSVVQDCGFPRSFKGRQPSVSPPPARQHYL